MSVVAVWEKPSPGGSSQSDADSEQVRLFGIRTNALSDNESTIMASGLLPVWLSAHPTNAAATRRRIELRRMKGFIWEAAATYSTLTINDSEKEKLSNPLPLDRRPKLKVQYSQEEERIIKDRNGHAMLNSAGCRFSESFTRRKTVKQIDVESFHASWPTFMDSLADRLNVASVNIKGVVFEAETLMFRPRGISEERTESGQTYYTASWFLEHKVDWKATALDKGFFALDSDDVLVPIEIDGEKPSEEQLLDGGGLQLPMPVDPEDAVFLEWDTEYTADFAPLPSLNF